MRYNLETMLPLGAFEHCGNRHIKLYGGGGSWNPVEIVENAFSSAGDVLADVDEFVNDEIPGGWVLPAAAAVAVTTGYVDPSIFAGEAAFTGATETGLATLAGEGIAADTIGATLLGGGEGFVGLSPEFATELGLYGESALGTEGFFGDPLANLYGLEGFGEIPMELLPEMIPEYPIDPGISLEQAQLGDITYPGDSQYEIQDLQEQARSTDVKPGSPTSWDRGIDPLFTPKDALTAARLGSGLIKILTPPRTPAGGTRSGFMPTSSTRSGLASSSSPLSRYLTQSGFNDASMPSGSSGSVGGALPGSLRETSLAAAPVTQGQSMNLNQLKQLYPQLSNVDPRILQMLTGKQSSTPNYFTYGGGDQGGGTAFTTTAQGGLPSAGIPSVASDRASQTKFAGASPIGGYSALNSAGLQAINTGALPGMATYGLKDGGNVHVPQFKTGTTGHFVQGQGDGQSDDIPAMLADGEYVFDADTVAALGNGSSKAGALQLDKMRQAIRKHKRSAPNDKIPPKAKSPLEYLKG